MAYESTITFSLDTICPWYAAFTTHLHIHLIQA